MTERSWRDVALGVYGGVAWLACIVLGAGIGIVFGTEDRPDGVVQGGRYGLASALPEILGAVVVLLLAAYGAFFWMWRRSR